VTKIGDYDDGYDEQPQIDGRVALWVMGALDEFKALDIIETVVGDEPLANSKQRKLYRQLKLEGFQPTLAEVEAVLDKFLIAEDRAGFYDLFRIVIEEGWEKFKKVRGEVKAQDVRDTEIRRGYGYPDNWVPL
jgi:hypothetical protein